MLHTTTSKTDLQSIISTWKEDGHRIGFVPTMGALHEGHVSLVSLALEQADRVIVSIFVNPTQFAPHEDFDSYPRDISGDIAKLSAAGAHAVYTPSVGDIYPDGAASTLKAGEAAKGLEGDCRPSHFDGVVTVVHRLFEHVQPDIAVFGEKDYQQLQVLKEMVAEHNLDITLIGAPIMRDEHGLALSSRNAYLSDKELAIARQLNVILREGQNSEAAKNALLAAGFDKVDYVEKRWSRILAAAWLGKTRLIDNMAL
jgi:pantoate--beta-alanine ligase